MSESNSLLSQLYAKMEEIDNLYKKIISSFPESGGELEPKFFYNEKKCELLNSNKEFAFYKVTLFLYKLYYERAGINGSNLKFVGKYAHQVYSFNQSDLENKYRQIVNDFRTVFCHYLKEDSKRDMGKLKNCQAWFLACIGENKPEDMEQWNICLCQLLNQAFEYLENIRKILAKIEELNEKEIYENWIREQKGTIPQYRKLKMMDTIKLRYGFHYDSRKFLSKIEKKIKDEINILALSDMQNDKIIEGIVEKIVLSSDMPMPLSGQDIMERYPDIGKKELPEIMNELQKKFAEDRTQSKEDLIKSVKIT